MAEKSGFFNALQVDGGYDRTYNANDYCDSLAVVISNGVLRSTADDLKVTANGLVPTVAAGWGWIKGHYYYNDTALSLAAVTAPVGGSRYDRIMLRFDNTLQQRRIHIVYVEGIASNNPTPPTPTRTDSVYELVLADLYITANATGMTVTDQRGNAELCGWVYSVSGDASFFTSLDNSFNTWFQSARDTLSSVTLFKRYTDIITLASQTLTVSFNIPQYDEDTCFIEVYVNGILDTDYTRNGNVITFNGLGLVAGTVVTVNAYKSIDGTGIETVADEITELQNQMSQVQGNGKYVYKCTGLNDNLSISQIANAIITNTYNKNDVTTVAAAFLEGLGATRQSGTTYTLNFDEEAQIGIDIVGKCGVSTAYSGAGTSANPYKWFNIGESNGETFGTKKRIIFDFAKCDKISVNCAANTYNYIFFGSDLTIKNIKCFVTSAGAGCNIYAVMGRANNGRINVDNCRFTISSTGIARIADHGTFTNCYGYIKSETSSAFCFSPKSIGLIRLIGGEYYAYVKSTSGQISAIVYNTASDTDGVLMATDIHCPVVALENYTQSYLSVAYAGKTYINGVVSRLTSIGDYNEIVGLINKNKA